MQPFDIHDQPTDHTGIPVVRLVPLTPSQSYLGGGLLLGRLVLGHARIPSADSPDGAE
jgi:hypothetical protein